MKFLQIFESKVSSSNFDYLNAVNVYEVVGPQNIVDIIGAIFVMIKDQSLK